MDGDLLDLSKLVEIKDRYKVWLLVDEAHSIGVLGKTGRGICEHTGVDPQRIDLIIGTLSKTFVSCGGFIAGKSKVIEWLRYTLPGFVYSVGLSPVITAAADTALTLLRNEPWRVERLRSHSSVFVKAAHDCGLNTGTAAGHAIIPILFSSNDEVVEASSELLNQGFFVPPIIQIGAPKNQPRLRFFLSVTHSEEELFGAINVLAEFNAARDNRGHSKLSTR